MPADGMTKPNIPTVVL